MPKKNPAIQTAVATALSEAGRKLRDEAVRFELLAKDIALDLCTNHVPGERTAKEEKIKAHLLRAETFKTAATLVAGK